MNTNMYPEFLRGIVAAVVLMAIAASPGAAQESSTPDPVFRFGLLAGAAYITSPSEPQRFISPALDPNFSTYDFSNPSGLTHYGAFLAEYVPGGLFGIQLRVSHDDRSVSKSDGGRELTVRLHYVAIEPALRVGIAGPFHLLAGPSVMFNVTHNYDFTADGAESGLSVTNADLQHTNAVVVGLWGEFGYDFALTSRSAATQWYLTPFLGAGYVADQKEPDSVRANADDVWSSYTIRGGLQIKLGTSESAPELIEVNTYPALDFTVATPSGGIVQPRQLVEQLPMLNYIFFDEGSEALPARYIRIDRSQAATFNENALPEQIGTGSVTPKPRAARQIRVYRNALNIIGHRLASTPEGTITLIGAAPDPADALRMADTIRDYLVSTFGIAPDRIETKGSTRSPHASGTRATPKEDLPLVAQENRRVEIVTTDPTLVRPTELRTLQEEPVDNDLLLTVNSNVALDSWTVAISGPNFQQTYGPFTTPRMRINATPILGSAEHGLYTATITGTSRAGQTLRQEKTFELLRKELPPLVADRYSILFEFDESRTVAAYEDFLRTNVAPQIPDGAAVFIHGHTDNIGEEEYNGELSVRRAMNVEGILEDELRKLGRNVIFDSYGFGEVSFRSPFDNSSPEGRYYNRTVVIDIIPAQ